MVSIERQAEIDRLRDEIDRLDDKFADFKEEASELLTKIGEIYEMLEEAENSKGD